MAKYTSIVLIALLLAICIDVKKIKRFEKITKPNVIIVYLRTWESGMGCYGATAVQTPRG